MEYNLVSFVIKKVVVGCPVGSTTIGARVSEIGRCSGDEHGSISDCLCTHFSVYSCPSAFSSRFTKGYLGVPKVSCTFLVSCRACKADICTVCYHVCHRGTRRAELNHSLRQIVLAGVSVYSRLGPSRTCPRVRVLISITHCVIGVLAGTSCSAPTRQFP